MRRKRNDQEESLTGRQRWAIYRKLFMEARPIGNGWRSAAFYA